MRRSLTRRMKALRVDTVSISQLVTAITLTGKIGTNDDNVVPVYSLVSGIVNDIRVNLGDNVSPGQTLAVVRSQEMAQYSSDLLNAETNLTVAQKNLEKTVDLFHSGLASVPDTLAARVCPAAGTGRAEPRQPGAKDQWR